MRDVEPMDIADRRGGIAAYLYPLALEDPLA
jgi:hypothetical protein